jgi:uncharacterized protein YcfJ
MKTRWTATTILLSAAACGTAWASHGGRAEYVYARVVDVDPIVRYVTVERPRRECREEHVFERRAGVGTAGATIAGGIVGGVIGHELGRGGARDTMTLLGTLVGAAVANDRAAGREAARGAAPGRRVPVTRCRVVNERFTERHIDGYRVTYEFRGRRYVMHTAEPPGERVRLRMSLVPADF